MEFDLLPWHWVVFGIALIVSEIFLPTFFILWFGAAAVIVGGVLFLMPDLSTSWQVFSWAIISTLLALGWFKFLKPLSIDRTKAGLSKEAIIGEIGQVIVVPMAEKRGQLRFPAPVLGDDEWLIISRDNVAIGDRVTVVDISGNALIVKKTN
jgi:membrane protein implicated in regulation of membrane protease activity